jgi:hypothetical protein
VRRVLAALALVALAVPAVAFAASWRIIAQGQATGKFSMAAASGTAMRPTAIQLKVTASPNIRTVAGYTIRCKKGAKMRRGVGKAVGRTPLTKAVTLPFARPASCVVVASATVTAAAKLTVTVRAR